jgi:hypothetical protein
MTDRSATTPHPAGIRAFVARRPVTAFLIMAFAIAYPIMSLPVLAVHRVIPGGQLLDRLPFPPDEIAGLMLTMFALLPPALFVTGPQTGEPASSTCSSGLPAGGLASAGGSLFLRACLF